MKTQQPDKSSDHPSTASLPAPRWIGLTLALLLVAITFAAYLPAIHGAFIWDDDEYITDNVLLRDLAGPRPDLVRARRHRAVLPSLVHHVLDRVPPLGHKPGRLSPHQHPPPGDRRHSLVARPSPIGRPRRLARRRPVRDPPGKRRVRRLDHRTQERPLWPVLLRGHARFPPLCEHRPTIILAHQAMAILRRHAGRSSSAP